MTVPWLFFTIFFTNSGRFWAAIKYKFSIKSRCSLVS